VMAVVTSAVAEVTANAATVVVRAVMVNARPPVMVPLAMVAALAVAPVALAARVAMVVVLAQAAPAAMAVVR